MSYLIIDISAEYTDRATGNRQIRAELIADSVSDLPANTTALTYLLGTHARTVDTGDIYYIDSTGTWIQQPPPNQLDLTGYYTSAETDSLLSGKQDSLTAAQLNAVNSGITLETVSTFPDIVDIGAKNMIKFYETATAGGGNAAINSNGYSVTLSGSSSVTGMKMADIIGLENATYILKYDTTGTTGSAIVIYDNTSLSNFRILSPGSGEIEISNFDPTHYYTLNNYVGTATTLNGTVSAMLCKKSLYEISSKYTPYRPTIYDVYNI